MSKTEYKRLGDYIREVDVRNRELKVKELVGLTINKSFIPSVANTIGTDLSNYKVIHKEQFACSLMQVSRDGKLPVAMFEGKCGIMSPAYPVFEVIDKTILLPQYLMMWFSRTEFDREASFYAVGGVRGSLTWQDFCDMTLPIPSIEQQRKIVAEYETISRRIRLNEQMIARLEETAQTLYRKMFVDGIDKENLPEGWRMGELGEICEINTDNISSKNNIKLLSYLDSSSVTQNVFDKYQIFNYVKDEIPSRAKRMVRYNDIIYSTVRPNLKHYGIIKDNVENIVVSTAFAVIRSSCDYISNELLYLILTENNNTELLQGIAEMSKATYPSITPEDIMNLKVLIPIKSMELNDINKGIKYCFNSIYFKHQENNKLKELQLLLLTKMR